MYTYFFIVIIIYCVNSVIGDVSHLQQSYHNLLDSFYGYQPVPILTTTTTNQPFLPEIIINRKTNEQRKNTNGYNYDRPENIFPFLDNPPSIQYIPPPQSIPENPQPTVFPFPPLNEQIPPNESYIPPLQDNGNLGVSIEPADKPGDVVVSYVSEGYDYNRPTTSSTTTNRPIIFTPGPVSDIPVVQSSTAGYVYEPPPPNSQGYLPPNSERSLKDFSSFSGNPKHPIQLQLNEMRCLHNQGGYFKSVITVNSFLGALPIIDNEIIDSRCDFRLIRTQLIINIAAEDFQRCGINNCGSNLCLRIRFPQIRGMKTEGDATLTLQCKVQDRIAVKTHAVKMGISNNAQARSIGAYAQGGSQQPFRTQMELFRKSPDGHPRQLELNGVVQLGEELLLRAHAQSGDGWNFTRLSDVQLQRVSPAGEIINSATLVTSSGCVNPSMRTICPLSPVFEPPLGHRLSFKAVMFQGMRSGDEILMSIKISGCIEQRDCYINTKLCDNLAGHPNAVRFKRSNMNSKNISDYSEVSTISFRVQMPQMKTNSDDSTSMRSAHLMIGGVFSFICLISISAVVIYLKLK